jgi:hypothetical protein
LDREEDWRESDDMSTMNCMMKLQKLVYILTTYAKGISRRRVFPAWRRGEGPLGSSIRA